MEVFDAAQMSSTFTDNPANDYARFQITKCTSDVHVGRSESETYGRRQLMRLCHIPDTYKTVKPYII